MVFGIVIQFITIVIFFVFLFDDDVFSLVLLATASFASFTLMLTYIRMCFYIPRDQPIRLNSKRQKIYTFDYKRKWWNPWAKWPTTVKAYRWADIHGEMRFSSDRYTGGFQLFASVCQPGTLNVVERFQIASGSPAQLQQLWSYLCLYMKGEPVPDEAVNKGRPDFWCPRKADKWPEALEIESTTAVEKVLP